MAADKNNPAMGREKMYQEHSYRPPFMPGTQYNHNRHFSDNSPRHKNIPKSDESLDRLMRTPADNEFYQQTAAGNVYELSQPIWFYMIMKRLAAEKEKKK